MKKVIGLLLVSALLTMITASSFAALYDVSAMENSYTGGSGAATISLTAGQPFTVTVDPSDLWNAGPLPRWSNADGLVNNLYATGSDESGQPFGLLIGQNYGTYSTSDLSAPYGTLVGRIDSGSYFQIGTSYSGSASASGTLYLYYWDNNSSDNTEKIAANVVPIPSALLLLGSGLIGFIGLRRRLGHK